MGAKAGLGGLELRNMDFILEATGKRPLSCEEAAQIMEVTTERGDKSE